MRNEFPENRGFQGEIGVDRENTPQDMVDGEARKIGGVLSRFGGSRAARVLNVGLLALSLSALAPERASALTPKEWWLLGGGIAAGEVIEMILASNREQLVKDMPTTKKAHIYRESKMRLDELGKKIPEMEKVLREQYTEAGKAKLAHDNRTENAANQRISELKPQIEKARATLEKLKSGFRLLEGSMKDDFVILQEVLKK